MSRYAYTLTTGYPISDDPRGYHRLSVQVMVLDTANCHRVLCSRTFDAMVRGVERGPENARRWATRQIERLEAGKAPLREGSWLSSL